MELSVSSYSFAGYERQGKLTQLTSIAKAKELGFNAIEFIDLTPPEGTSVEDYAKLLRKEADKNKMAINAYTVCAKMYLPTKEEREKEIENVLRKVDIASILGAKIMRHDSTFDYFKTTEGRSFDQMLPYIAENAVKVTEYAKQFGIKTCTENHGFIAQDSYRLEKLFNTVANENYGLLIDIGNFACADEDSIKAVSRLAPYAVHVHAKDFYKRTFKQGKKDGFFMTRECNYLRGSVIGDGIIPVKQCLAILKKAGYNGYVTIEYEGAKDCLKGIKIGADRVKKYLAENEKKFF